MSDSKRGEFTTQDKAHDVRKQCPRHAKQHDMSVSYQWIVPTKLVVIVRRTGVPSVMHRTCLVPY
jgi:hypothetical protein